MLPSSSGFTFGSATPSTTTPAAPTTSTGGFTFGSTTSTTTPSTGGFTFGKPASTTTTTAPSTGGFTFGTSSAPATTGGFTFGTPAPATTGGFSSTGFSFGTQQQQQQQQQQQVVQPLPSGAILPQGGVVREIGDPVLKRINQFSRSIDPTSPHCLYQYVLYNSAPPGYRDKLVKPPHANDEVWARGKEDNPDPENLVPCLVVGFNDLIVRLQEQNKATSMHQSTMESLANKVEELEAKQTELHASVEQASQNQILLSYRLLALMNKLDLIKSKDTPLLESEVDFYLKLQAIQNELDNPNQFLGKIQELHSLVSVQTSMVSPSFDSSQATDNSMSSLLTVVHEQAAMLQEICDEVALCKTDLEVLEQVQSEL